MSGGGGAARLADGWGVSQGSVGVPVSYGLVGEPLIGVSTGGAARLSGIAIDEGKEHDW